MADSTIDPRLQALLDKQEIYELVCAYCNAADRHDHAKMRTLYHEDAIDEHGSLFSGPAMQFIPTSRRPWRSCITM